MISFNNPGRLDRRIQLLAPTTARNSIGEEITTYVEAATVWAQWLPQSSREFIAAQARHAETTGIFRIRHRNFLGAQYRVQLGDDVFTLTGDPIEVGRRDFLDLPVAALDQSPSDPLSARLLHDGLGSFRLLHDDTPAVLHSAA